MNSRTTIKLNSDFRRLYAKGRSAVGPLLVVYCRKNRSGTNRFGYTVSTKLGHAVVRNRIRRRLREITRLNSDKVLTGYDIVIVARGRSVGAHYRKLEAACLEACRQLSLLRREERVPEPSESAGSETSQAGEGSAT